MEMLGARGLTAAGAIAAVTRDNRISHRRTGGSLSVTP
jgi:hypothetical protein